MKDSAAQSRYQCTDKKNISNITSYKVDQEMTKEESKFTAADELDDGLVYDYEDNGNEAEIVQLEHLSDDDSVTEKPVVSVTEKRGKKRSKNGQSSLKEKVSPELDFITNDYINFFRKSRSHKI